MLTSQKVAEEFGDILPIPVPPTSRHVSNVQVQQNYFRRSLREACIDTFVLEFDNDDFNYPHFEKQLDAISSKYQNAYPKRHVKNVVYKGKRTMLNGKESAILEIRLNTLETLEISLERRVDLSDIDDDISGSGMSDPDMDD